MREDPAYRRAYLLAWPGNQLVISSLRIRRRLRLLPRRPA